MTTYTLRDDVAPYDTRTDSEHAAESWCELCDEGIDWDGPHSHSFYVSREGASTRTADNLVAVFLDDTAELTTYAVPEWVAEIEWDRDYSAGWCVNPDDSQALYDEIIHAESALSDCGLFVVWDDGYSIQSISELEVSQ